MRPTAKSENARRATEDALRAESKPTSASSNTSRRTTRQRLQPHPAPVAHCIHPHRKRRVATSDNLRATIPTSAKSKTSLRITRQRLNLHPAPAVVLLNGHFVDKALAPIHRPRANNDASLANPTPTPRLAVECGGKTTATPTESPKVNANAYTCTQRPPWSSSTATSSIWLSRQSTVPAPTTTHPSPASHPEPRS
jgi:hypothetical protein